MTDDVLAAFRRYTEAFQSQDPRAVAPHFHQPAIMITPKGIVALSSGADVERFYRGVMDELPRDYASTEFQRVVAQRLGPDLAVVRGGGFWKTRSGAEVMRFGMTYTFHKTGDGWKIVTAAVHEPIFD